MEGGLLLDPFFLFGGDDSSTSGCQTHPRLDAREALSGSKSSWIGTSEQVHPETEHSPYYARVVEMSLQNK